MCVSVCLLSFFFFLTERLNDSTAKRDNHCRPQRLNQSQFCCCELVFVCACAVSGLAMFVWQCACDCSESVAALTVFQFYTTTLSF